MFAVVTTISKVSTINVQDFPVRGVPAGEFVELPGRGTTYIRERRGPKGAPTVILLHGWGTTAALNWFRCFDPLAEHYRVIAMDVRGHGQGIRARSIFRLEDCADDVAVLAEQLGIKKFIPVGYSMGGTIAQLVAHRHGPMVDGLVLCSTAPEFRAEVSPFKTDITPAPVMWGAIIPALTATMTFMPGSIRRTLLRKVLFEHVHDGTPRWMLEELALTDPAAMMQAGFAIGHFNSGPWLGTLGIASALAKFDTGVVVTLEDRTIPANLQQRLVDEIPNAQAFEVDADHRAAITQVDRFLPELLNALKHVTTRTYVSRPNRSRARVQTETSEVQTPFRALAR